MLLSNGETYKATIIKRVKNSDYTYEDKPFASFRCRPANNVEKKLYRVQQGVNSSDDSVTLFVTRLPLGIEIKDKIKFLGKEWTIVSIGYYFDNNRIVNAGAMNDDYLINRCPKGLTLA